MSHCSAHRQGDPDFAIHLGLQFALLDEIRIPEPLLEATGVLLDDPAFDPDLRPEAMAWCAQLRSGSKPISITWRLRRPMPQGLYLAARAAAT